MNRRSWLIISLCLNLLLAVLVAWAAKSRLDRAPSPIVSQTITQRFIRLQSVTNLLVPPVVEVAAPFHWRQLESTDYRVYVENLRAVGCPELTIFDIVAADVNDLFFHRVGELVDGVTGRFWDLAARPQDMKNMVEAKEKELSALDEQKDEIMAALFGETNPADKLLAEENQTEQLANDRQTLGFLSAEKSATVIEIRERATAARRALDALPPPERQLKIRELEAQQQRDLQAALTPAEYGEYQLRTGNAANIRDQLTNFDGTEAEFRAVALAKMNSKSDQPIQQLLGPEKFAAYQRALDNDYGQALRITDRFDLPDQTAVQIYQMKKEVEARAKELRADPNRPLEERQAILQAMQAEAEKSFSAALGPEAFKAYQKYNGGWIEHLAGNGN